MRVVSAAGSHERGKFRLDVDHAVSALHSTMDLLGADTLRVRATSRVLGLHITSKEIRVSEDLLLTRLTRAERNSRQPFLRPFNSDGLAHMWRHKNHVEATLEFEEPVDRSQENAFFTAGNAAAATARTRLEALKNALYLVSERRTVLSPISLDGIITPTGTPGWNNPWVMPKSATLRAAEAPKLEEYLSLTSGASADRVLNRGLRRFFGSAERADPSEALVDLVIAWETILLTVTGNAVKQELSYRFALNGACCCVAIGVMGTHNEHHAKMKAAYGVRSEVVHGSDDDKVKKAYEAAGFSSLPQLNDYLSSSYRLLVPWLLERDVAERPYKKKSGWELLLWPNS